MRSLQPLNNDWGFYVNNKQDFHRSNQHQRFFHPKSPSPIARFPEFPSIHQAKHSSLLCMFSVLLLSSLSISYSQNLNLEFLIGLTDLGFIILHINLHFYLSDSHQSSIAFICFTSIFNCFYLLSLIADLNFV